MKLNTCLFIAALPILSLGSAQSDEGPASALSVESFGAHEELAAAILTRLAQQTHIAIGVSGENVGPDSRLISVTSGRTSLKNLLDEICLQDPRYSWKDTADGSISITIGPRRLDLVDITVERAKLTEIRSTEAISWMLQMPEVQRWEKRNKCSVAQGVAMGPKVETWNVNVDLSEEPLWRVLDELAVQSKTYFWSAVKFSNDPCEVNLIP